MSPSAAETTVLRIGHSPDPDDAFMWFPLADFPDGSGPGGKTWTPRIDTGPFRFRHVLEDIELLNRRAQRGELEITALSFHQYPFIADRYALTSCGASMGDGYGPMVVARERIDLRRLATPDAARDPDRSHAPRIAIPGRRTTAWLAFQLRMRELGVRGGTDPDAIGTIRHTVVPFDQIIPRVASGEFDAGLIIHEGQLTYAEAGLVPVLDLGRWWAETRGLPLPLGGNAIRRDLAARAGRICRILLESIRYALDHRQQAVRYAMHYARDMGPDLADRFVGMYVNSYTLDCGDTGRRAVRQLLREAAETGITPPIGEIDFIRPA